MRKYIPYIYLILSLLGLIAFFYVNKGIAQAGNFNVIDFISSTWTANFYAKSISVDFWVAATTGLFFMMIEAYRLKMKKVWVFVLLSFLVAFAFAFPLFLFFRHKKLHAKQITEQYRA